MISTPLGISILTGSVCWKLLALPCSVFLAVQDLSWSMLWALSALYRSKFLLHKQNLSYCVSLLVDMPTIDQLLLCSVETFIPQGPVGPIILISCHNHGHMDFCSVPLLRSACNVGLVLCMCLDDICAAIMLDLPRTWCACHAMSLIAYACT